MLTAHRAQLVALVAVFILCMSVSAAKNRITEKQRDARKSDYIFLEALSQQNQDHPDAYFALIERAHELNPDDKFVAMQHGLKMMYEADNDSLQMQQGLQKMREYVESTPSDFYSALNYASLCSKFGNEDDAMKAWTDLYNANSDRIEIGGMYAEFLTQTANLENMRKAIDIYNDIERIEGVNPTTSTRKMRLYNMMSDTASVLKEMRALLESSPSSAQYAAMAGNLFMEFGNRDSALVFFDKAVDIEPTNGAVRYQRALYYEAIGDSAKYDSEVFQSLELPDLELSTKLEMLYDYVRKLYADTLQQPRIESMFKSLVSQYPHEASVRNLYGDYLVTIAHYAPAAEQISYALDSDPSDVKRWHLLGSLYFTLNDMGLARATAEKALKYHPDSPTLYNLASSVSITNKNYQEAINYLRKGIEVADSTDYTELSNLNCSMGDAFYADSLIDSAFVYYKKALDLNPDNSLALNNCAYYLACQERDLDEALKMIEKVVEQSPESATSLDTYAWVLFKRKDYAKAKEIIDAAIEHDETPGGSGELLDHAGDIYFMDGNPEKAVDLWKKALKLKPDNELLKRKVKHKTFFYK